MNIYTYYGNIEHLKAFDNDYQLKGMYTPPIDNQRRPLKKISDRTCRFCGKKSTETTFKGKPHIISRLFGNNSGVSDYECDKCNNHFSGYESDMANFLGLNRSVNALGTQTPPTFKSYDGNIVAKKNNFNGFEGIEIESSKEGVIQKKDGGIIEFNVIHNPYIPINIFKCLLKIALTVIPDYEVANYKLCFDFLMENKNETYFAQHAKQIHKGLSGFNVKFPYVLIFKKRNLESKLPSHWIKLYYQDSYIQFYIPYHKGDKVLQKGEEISYPLCPPLIFADTQPQGIAKNYEKLDLSSNVMTKGKTSKLNLTFDENLLSEGSNNNQETHNSDNFNSDEIIKVFLTKNSGLLEE
ncbi:hypothetical protein [Chryseobacterium sp. G0201]|uniref:hypothetical protein n=1 Tax=Chryseobacterium sp. G0201 TaxID=2487065 RepID=UPI000F5040BC|nr:hypothetical protein [Chryseobacterium sp. G0201]AZA53767.1 hypothetical protein EG348_12490 [Chryseobacterium sp. G0201]